MLHDYLESRCVRGRCETSFVLLLSTPEPPSPESSKALIAVLRADKENFVKNLAALRLHLSEQ
jgi:sulfide:quinone oxidoreductase